MMRTILVSILGFCVLQVCAQPVTHQNLFDTVPFIQKHHENRLKLFEKQPMKTRQVIFLGNSITEGGNWAQLTGLDNTLNRGIGGDITYGLLERVDEIIDRHPSRLFIMIGINDIGKDIPPSVIADNVRKLVSRVKKGTPETEVIVQSILPVNPEFPGFPQHYNKQYQVMVTNQLLEKTAFEEKVRYINLFPYFLDDWQRLDASLTSDGLHLNDRGYQQWVGLLRKFGIL